VTDAIKDLPPLPENGTPLDIRLAKAYLREAKRLRKAGYMETYYRGQEEVSKEVGASFFASLYRFIKHYDLADEGIAETWDKLCRELVHYCEWVIDNSESPAALDTARRYAHDPAKLRGAGVVDVGSNALSKEEAGVLSHLRLVTNTQPTTEQGDDRSNVDRTATA
jgi:hypothetical protein